uniref:Uncharacterized protein n=1 Tax=Rhizophora mucronata TaxID=61149 RepID=A0A2P2KXY8_RHIMU
MLRPTCIYICFTGMWHCFWKIKTTTIAAFTAYLSVYEWANVKSKQEHDEAIVHGKSKLN